MFQIQHVRNFVAMVCIAVPHLHAQQSPAPDPFAIDWAWSKLDVQGAGEAFWPQFRGPTGDGHTSPSANLPTQWSETENVRWRTDIPGKAWSSPVVWGDTVWVTTASENGLTMSALSLDRKTGAIRWNKEVFTNEETQKDFHAFNSYGSPTPVVDANHLYVSFGAYGTAALKRETGEIVWQRRDLKCNHFRGAGSSPILFRNLLIFHMDGFDKQFVVALNKQTGETVWLKDRNVQYGTDDGDVKKAFGTPHIVEATLPDGTKQIQMLSTTSKAIIAYDPTSGKELWHVRYGEFSSASRPLFDGKVVYTNTGFSKGKMIAIAMGGSGDITKSHVLWEAAKAIGNKPSPLLIGDKLICSLDDKGILTALDRSTGLMVWQERLGGDFSSSPILAANRIYCLDEKGKGHVYSIEGKALAVNTLDAGCLASPAVAGNDLIVRTRNALYCIGDKK